ncbi:cholecystokinin receptor type A-like [Saccoglossus kowalevskii]
MLQSGFINTYGADHTAMLRKTGVEAMLYSNASKTVQYTGGHGYTVCNETEREWGAETLKKVCNFTLFDIPDSNTAMNGTFINGTELGSYLPQMDAKLSAILYSLIFLLAIVGNVLVIVTLIQNRRMRTVTNLFLFSLALSDLLFALFCMPSTIIGAILQNFIFGAGFCKVIVYCQALSVFVSVWTLVAISIERHFAICQPLSSRRWQTKSHAYKTITAVWFIGIILFIPSAYFANLEQFAENRYRCNDFWPSPAAYQFYVTFLLFILMIAPLFVMTVAYSLVIKDLWRGMQNEKKDVFIECKSNSSEEGSFKMNNTTGSFKLNSIKKASRHRKRILRNSASNAAKRKVVGMLIVIVAVFFVCWTPLWCLNIWYVYDMHSAMMTLTPVQAAVLKLIAHISTCINPIIYCFMLKKFRQGFLEVFTCCREKRDGCNNTRSSTYKLINLN